MTLEHTQKQGAKRPTHHAQGSISNDTLSGPTRLQPDSFNERFRLQIMTNWVKQVCPQDIICRIARGIALRTRKHPKTIANKQKWSSSVLQREVQRASYNIVQRCFNVDSTWLGVTMLLRGMGLIIAGWRWHRRATRVR
jgi:hypothetical protein